MNKKDFPEPSTELGGVVILLQEPVENNCCPYMPDGDSFYNLLAQIKGFKEIDGPMGTCTIAGTWPIVFEVDEKTDIEELKRKCVSAWKRAKRSD